MKYSDYLSFIFLLIALPLLNCCTKINHTYSINQDDDIIIESLKINKDSDFITVEDAINIAQLHNIYNISDTKSSINKQINNSSTIYDDNNTPLMYVINYKSNQGFTIVGADKNYPPILAYSEKGSFKVDKELPVQIWIEEHKEKIQYQKEQSSTNKNYRHTWSRYEKNNYTTKSESLNSVRDAYIAYYESQGYTCYPLYERPDGLPENIYNNFCQEAEGMSNPDYDYLTNSLIMESNSEYFDYNSGILVNTNWSQSSEYYTGENGFLGSTTIALGQIMKYHEWSTEYYDWDLMENNNPTTETRRLLTNIHNSINSSIFEINAAKNFLVDYGYNDANVQNHNKTTVFNNINANRPVLMSGYSGMNNHSWICAGYRYSSNHSIFELHVLSVIPPLQYENTGLNYSHVESNGGYYYMKWGWGGDNDGWFFDDSVNSGNGNFNSNRKDIVDIYPQAEN